MIAEDEVPLRPGRREPRAVKRRPKPYGLLTCHRTKYRETDHRSKWPREINPRILEPLTQCHSVLTLFNCGRALMGCGGKRSATFEWCTSLIFVKGSSPEL